MSSKFIRAIMANAKGLGCTVCAEKYPVDAEYQPCPKCGGQLLLDLDLQEISKKINEQVFAKRGWSIWRYRELLPDVDEERIVSLGEGGTALLECKRLARELGLQKLLIKDETTNPTGSFLDRGMTVDISRANELGFQSVNCHADSGNFAASASAYAARAGFKCIIYLPRERIEAVNVGKLYQIIAYGGSLIIEDPSMIWRGITELRQLGFINGQKISMMGVQLESYGEIVDSLHGRKNARTSRDTRKTVAVELATKRPSHGYLAIDAIRGSRGEGVKVKDIEVLDAMTLLARTEGIFAEPAAASTIAGLRRMIDQGAVSKDETIVCVITGAGLKDPYTARRFTTKLKQVDRILSQIESRNYTTRLGRTKLTMLRVIANKETYGYEIWRSLQKRGLKLDISSVYQHLSELEKVGLVTRSRTESVLGKPKRCYYATTVKGRSFITKHQDN